MEINTDDNNSSSEYMLLYAEDLNISIAEELVETPEWEYRFAVPAIFLIFMITGMLGNGLVVLVFIKNKTFRTITNMFLLNLAVTDLMYLSFCVPFGATRYYKGYWIFGNTLCEYSLIITFFIDIKYTNIHLIIFYFTFQNRPAANIFHA